MKIKILGLCDLVSCIIKNYFFALILGICFFLSISDSYGQSTGVKIKLAATYPNESWMIATQDDFKWIVGEWFYPTLPDFYSRFKIENGKLYQQNEGVHFESFVTEWVEVEVFINENGIIRLRYKAKNWPGMFIYNPEGSACEFYENNRSVLDDGTVKSGEKRLVLNKKRCVITRGGITYECDCDK